jgi:hypothetical protein
VSSKLINADPEFFSKLVIDSIKYVKQEGFLGGKPKYNIKSLTSSRPTDKAALRAS